MIIFREITDGKFLLDKDSFRTISRYDSTLEKMFLSKHNIYETWDDIRGANCKFWIKNESVPHGLLFKYPHLRQNGEIMANNYGELLVDLICDKIGMDHTSYYPCKFILQEGTELEGTLCPSYRSSEYNTEYSAHNITTRYIQSQYDNNFGFVAPMEHNTVYEYLKQIKTLYPKWVQKSGISQMKDYMLKMALLDFLTMQVDRHWGNFGYLTNSKKGMSSVKVIPLFDNGCSFNGDKPISKMTTLNRSIVTNKHWEKRVILPMVSGKENSPLLGIKTSLVELKGERTLVNRKYSENEASNVEIFANEIVDEISENKSLAKFYESLTKLDVEKLFIESGYFPDEVVTVASKIWQGRMQILQQTMEQKRGKAYER